MAATARNPQASAAFSETPAPLLPPRQARHELVGALTILTGIFVLVCLLVGTSPRHIGAWGVVLRDVLTVPLGVPVSFLVPVALLWFGIEAFFGRLRLWSTTRVVGLLLTAWVATGLLALPGAEDPAVRQEVFLRAGAMGVFLVEPEGLGLVGHLGFIGATLLLTGLLLVGLVMTTNLGLSAMVRGISHPLRDRFDRTSTRRSDLIEDLDRDEPAPARRSRKSIAPPEPIDHITAPAPEAPPTPRVTLWGRMRNLFARRRSAASLDSSRILSPVDDLSGWDEPADADVAAAARAVERHEWEHRFLNRVREPLSSRRAMQVVEEEEVEEDDDIIGGEDEDFLDEDTFNTPEPEEDDAETDIIFRDHSQPLDNRITGNPADELHAGEAPRVGEGLAKLFPSRWPKDGVPAETAEEVAAKSEERLLRQMGEAAEREGALEADPLFTAEFDTRPHGASGVPAEREVLSMLAQHADELASYRLPSIELLTDPPVVDSRMTREEMLEISQTLTDTLKQFGVEGRVTEVHQGPVVTRFEFRPAAGIKVSRITNLDQDLAMAMRADSIRIQAPIPGKNAVGIEVPNKRPQAVYLKELVACPEFWDHPSPLAFALGKTIEGRPYFQDLAKMPHLLIAGATGAGKSVCLNTIICSLLYRRRPDQLRLIMVDPKRVELSVYADIPHLLAPVVCEPKCAAGALHWAVEQMEERYKRLVQLGVRNIDGYNRVVANPEAHARARGKKLEPMPYMVVVVDELADLMLVAKAEVEESIQRLAQMARAVGIHLILATQRPSVNVITGIIKANFPSRIAFQVSQKVDSRTILDANGAEALLGRGDMLFSKPGAGKPERLQGAFLSDDEVESIAEWCRNQMPPMYEMEEFEARLSEKEQRELAKMMGVESMDDLDAQGRIVRGTNRVMGKVTSGMFIPHGGGSARAGDDEIDEALVRAAARLILESRKASVSLLQRRLKVGFARAGRLMDMLEEMGIVGEFKGSKPRDIIIDPEAGIAELDKLEATLDRSRTSAAILNPQRPLEEEEEYEDEEADEEEEDALDEEDEYEDEEEEYEEEDEDLEDPNKPWPRTRRG